MGKGIYVRTAYHRRINSEAHLGKKFSEQRRLNLVGRKLTKKHINNIKRAKNTPECRELARRKTIAQFNNPISREKHRFAVLAAMSDPKMKEHMRVVTNSEAHKDVMRKVVRKRKANGSYKRTGEKISKAMTGKKLSEEHKRKLSIVQKEVQRRPEIVENKRVKGLKRWSDPDYAKKVFGAVSESPNGKEIQLDKILQEILPGEYLFTGDGSMPINSKHPDFTNIAGKKKIIELYGTGPHADPHKYVADQATIYGKTAGEIWKKDNNRVRIIRNKGYMVLIIWQRELRCVEKLKKKILDFNNLK